MLSGDVLSLRVDLFIYSKRRYIIVSRMLSPTLRCAINSYGGIKLASDISKVWIRSIPTTSLYSIKF